MKNYDEEIKKFEKAMTEQFAIAIYVVEKADKYRVALEKIAKIDPQHGEAQEIARKALKPL